MKICILSVATNKYIRFVDALYESIGRNFLIGHDLHYLLFTDYERQPHGNVTVRRVSHEPWPYPTLRRYSYFLLERDLILQSDYCFYLDVDMRVDSEVGDEVLGELVATLHPYKIWESNTEFPYERDPRSLAYIPYGDGEKYFCGGFIGGSSGSFIRMSEVIAERVNRDLGNGLIAVWHDESHLNRYLIDNRPTTILTPSYCYPEELIGHAQYPYDPKIIALKKDHAEVRS
jgi:histo-blood group ABO system transferase